MYAHALHRASRLVWSRRRALRASIGLAAGLGASHAQPNTSDAVVAHIGPLFGPLGPSGRSQGRAPGSSSIASMHKVA